MKLQRPIRIEIHTHGFSVKDTDFMRQVNDTWSAYSRRIQQWKQVEPLVERDNPNLSRFLEMVLLMGLAWFKQEIAKPIAEPDAQREGVC